MGRNYDEVILKTQLNLAGLTIYRNLIDDPIVTAYSLLLEALENPEAKEELLSCYNQVFSLLLKRYADDEQAADDLWKHHVIQLILSDENVFSLACEKGTLEKL